MLQQKDRASGETMTVAEYCIFGTLVLYLVTIVPIKWIGFRRYDNSRPRDPAFYDDPLRTRALGAHQNGIEAFPFFAAAVLLAEFRGCHRSCGTSVLRSISPSSSCRCCAAFCRCRTQRRA